MQKIFLTFCLLSGISLVACATHPPPGANPAPTPQKNDTAQAHKRNKRFL